MAATARSKGPLSASPIWVMRLRRACRRFTRLWIKPWRSCRESLLSQNSQDYFVNIMATKNKSKKETQLLELLKAVLPKAVPDPKLAQKIFAACEDEIKAKTRGVAFEEFCRDCDLPDLKAESVQ